MEKLFNDSEVFQKERPTNPTDAQVEDFYLRMAKEIKDEGFSKSSESTIAEDLKDLFPFHDNGFEMAKELERGNASYSIDSNFCEWLDTLHYEWHTLNDDNVKDWVKAHNPQPKFKKGDKLLIKEKLIWTMGKDTVVYVNGLSEERACYLIDENSESNGGTVLAYELVESKCELIS